MYLRVNFDEIETSEEDIFREAKYQGKLFSGTAIADDGKVHSEYRYNNGLGEGRSFSVYENGQLEGEWFMENGETITETQWYENGTVRLYFQKEPLLQRFFDRNGNKIKEITQDYDKKWYKSGELKIEYDKIKKESVYYVKNGEWVVKSKLKEKIDWKDPYSYIFNDYYIKTHYMELLEDSDFTPYFIQWLPKPPKKKKIFFPFKKRLQETEQYIQQIICDMIASDNMNIKYDGICFAQRYTIKKALPLLKQSLNCNEKPKYWGDETDGLWKTYSYTVAERAKMALKDLA